MLSQLPPRERQIVDLLYQKGALTVSEVCDALPVALSGSAVRAMLTRLEAKGFVNRADSERGFVFSPTMPDSQARRTALSQVVRTFFNGSTVSAASALLGMAKQLDENELSELEMMIARARKEKEAGQ
ncbi:MAG: BlaI/MecI/CopY family transcriptional regulator [Sphingobium sp.]|nr:BlaI/MecI/CopY family transcriptional regulator [Sphingobium sp.]